MIAPLTDNIVAKQLGRLVADAEALLGVAAWRDLPAGLRIIPCDGRRLSGFSLGSGHRLAQAHGCRPGAVAIAVAAEDALRVALNVWPDELPAALGEAALAIEITTAHELAHSLVAPIDAELQPDDADILRCLPAAVGTVHVQRQAKREARDHGAAWAAGIVILARRCEAYRPRAHHRWRERLDDDLRGYGLDPMAVADAVGDVGDEQPLRELLTRRGAIVARVAEAIADEAGRAALIAARWQTETTPAEPGHVAPVAAGVS